ncbi:MAG: extensin-like domain-containing protein [Alphaproteobacteria bacterium]
MVCCLARPVGLCLAGFLALVCGEVAAQSAPDGPPVPRIRPMAQNAPAVIRSDRTGGGPRPTADDVCRARLANFGVNFDRQPAIRGTGKCGVAAPLAIREIAPGVAVSPDTMVNCAITEALALWVRADVGPAARRHLGTELTGLRQNATYVCRTRNGQSGAGISEHAFGNAIDVAAFNLADGTSIDVSAHAGTNTPAARFLSEIREAACGPFRTVLGPGSDARHSDHFHFDRAERRGDPYCR